MSGRDCIFPLLLMSPTQVPCSSKFTVQNGAFLLQVMMRPMFGAYGKAGSSNSIAFVSKVRLTTNSFNKFRLMSNVQYYHLQSRKCHFLLLKY